MQIEIITVNIQYIPEWFKIKKRHQNMLQLKSDTRYVMNCWKDYKII